MSISHTSCAGSPARIHSAITLPDPAGAGEAVRAEAGGHEEAAHLALAEAELVVGGERLRTVDQARDRDLVHHRHAPARVGGDLLEARPVLLEQAAVEVRAGSRRAGARPAPTGPRSARSRPSRARRPPRGSRSTGRGRAAWAGARARPPTPRSRKGWVTRYSWANGTIGTRTPAMRADLRGEHAARVDHHLGLDRTPLGLHAAHAPAAGHARSTSMPVTRVCVKICAPPSRAPSRQRHRQQRGVEVAVARQVGCAAHARRCSSAGTARAPPRRRSARAAARTSSPTRPGAAPPARARACTPGGCRRTAPSRSRACRTARPSPSSCASASTLERSCPTSPAEWKVEPLVSSLRSSSTTSRSPSCARWWAIEAPPTPPPMMTTRARSGSSRGLAIVLLSPLRARSREPASKSGRATVALRRSKCSRA